MTEMSVAKAWVMQSASSRWMVWSRRRIKEYIELEKQGKATTQDLKKYLDKRIGPRVNPMPDPYVPSGTAILKNKLK